MTVPQPGCVPLRPLRLTDILDGAFAVVRRNPRGTLGLSAIVAAVEVVVVFAVQLGSADALGRVTVTSRWTATASTGLGPLLGGTGPKLITLAASTLLGALLTGLLTVVVTQDVLGERVGPAEAWRRSRGRRWRLLLTGVVVAVAEVVGLLLFVVPGVWLWGVWAAAVPALMVERTSVRGALRRSRQLVRGDFWRVWWTRVAGVIVVTIVRLLIAVPFTAVGWAIDSGAFSSAPGGHHAPLLFAMLTAFGAAVAGTLTTPVRAGVDALIYLDLRMRREGLDIVLLSTGPDRAGRAMTVGAGR